MHDAIKIASLQFTYRRSDKPALMGIDLAIKPAEFVVIVGPSGAGKSTLCYTFNGLVPKFLRGELAGSVAVGLSGLEHREPATLSGGQKQRLAIASVLSLEPRMIVMDEPTTDLDPLGKEGVFAVARRLRARGLTMVIAEHETEEAAVVLSGGNLIFVQEITAKTFGHGGATNVVTAGAPFMLAMLLALFLGRARIDLTGSGSKAA